jgi:uncharacterized protein
MRARPELRFDPAAVAQLACPACRGDLRVSAENAPAILTCIACGRAYPIVDAIPVLIVERARLEPAEDKTAPGE